MNSYGTSYDSPMGTLWLTSNGIALTGLYLPSHRGSPERQATEAEKDLPLFREAKRQLSAYFQRELTVFDLPLAPDGTPFQRRVWEELITLPYGQTISYGELARRLGNPSASRAVGLANGQNPISIIVPCHRVIGADGKLVGYGGGLASKQALLDFEATARQPTLFVF